MTSLAARRADPEITLTLTEIMRRLGFADESFVTRKQLAKLLGLASPSALEPASRSRQYRAEEIAGALAAIDLLKQQSGHESGALRINISQLARACARLQAFGIPYPLSQAALSWDVEKRRYVFTFDGFLVDAAGEGRDRIENLLRSLGHSESEITDAVDKAAVAMRRRTSAASTLLREMPTRRSDGRHALILE